MQCQSNEINIANYDITAYLDHNNHTLNGEETIEWINPSTDTVAYLLLHVYYNAFRNNLTTFFQESKGLPDFFRPKNCEWGGTDIYSLQDENGKDLMNLSGYVNTDTNNSEDKSVFKIGLNQKVLPKEKITIHLKWKSKIPKAMVRTGYSKDFYFFAQWFPKLAVYEPKGMRYSQIGNWNCHEYHAEGEYYSDFGSYNVKMVVPADFIVSATGNKISEKSNGNSRVYEYKEKKIIDFAWVASPILIVDTVKWKGVDIILATNQSHLGMKDRYFKSVINSLEFLDQTIGKYPYKTLTIVDPPLYGTFCSGMEYPTLITTLGFRFLPSGFKSTETLTTHELIHQYFMQLIASNESEEPWLDEGITTYYEGRILDHFNGKDKSFVDIGPFKIGNTEYNRGEFFTKKAGRNGNNTMKSWEFPDGAYSPISYNKTAIWLLTLEGLIGRETFDKGMKRYFETWQYRHPCGEDFIQTMNEVVRESYGTKYGENLDWFFNQTYRSNMRCDYSIDDINLLAANQKTGLLESIDSCQTVNISVKKKYEYEIKIKRNEDMILPVELLIFYENDSTSMILLDGKEYEHYVRLESDYRIKKAVLDPEQKLYIDENFLNNSYTLQNNHLSLGSMLLILSEKSSILIDLLTSFI